MTCNIGAGFSCYYGTVIIARQKTLQHNLTPFFFATTDNTKKLPSGSFLVQGLAGKDNAKRTNRRGEAVCQDREARSATWLISFGSTQGKGKN